MADENELCELCERISRLGGGDQTRLLEMVLAENRRQEEELREAGKLELAAWEEWHLRGREAAQTELLQQIDTLREFERQPGRDGLPRTKREAG